LSSKPQTRFIVAELDIRERAFESNQAGSVSGGWLYIVNINVRSVEIELEEHL
tara:strand:- start:2278 stop:2436 length:159 start_codon:yes stop_codon:yes gene_type:complete